MPVGHLYVFLGAMSVWVFWLPLTFEHPYVASVLNSTEELFLLFLYMLFSSISKLTCFHSRPHLTICLVPFKNLHFADLSASFSPGLDNGGSWHMAPRACRSLGYALTLEIWPRFRGYRILMSQKLGIETGTLLSSRAFSPGHRGLWKRGRGRK